MRPFPLFSSGYAFAYQRPFQPRFSKADLRIGGVFILQNMLCTLLRCLRSGNIDLVRPLKGGRHKGNCAVYHGQHTANTGSVPLLSVHKDHSLTHAKGWYDAPAGRIESAWEKLADGTIRLNLTIPESVTARVILDGASFPDGEGEKVLPSGQYIVK